MFGGAKVGPYGLGAGAMSASPLLSPSHTVYVSFYAPEPLLGRIWLAFLNLIPEWDHSLAEQTSILSEGGKVWGFLHGPVSFASPPGREEATWIAKRLRVGHAFPLWVEFPPGDGIPTEEWYFSERSFE